MVLLFIFPSSFKPTLKKGTDSANKRHASYHSCPSRTAQARAFRARLVGSLALSWLQ